MLRESEGGVEGWRGEEGGGEGAEWHSHREREQERKKRGGSGFLLTKRLYVGGVGEVCVCVCLRGCVRACGARVHACMRAASVCVGGVGLSGVCDQLRAHLGSCL